MSLDSCEKDPNHFSAIRHYYQQTVESLLDDEAIVNFPAINIKELQAFRDIYGMSAFVCRYQYCGFSTNGFESSSRRSKHEATHQRRFRCSVSSCFDFSAGFTTKSKLNKHNEKYHPYIVEGPSLAESLALPRPRTPIIAERQPAKNNLKRPSNNDDVIEVPNPNAQQAARQTQQQQANQQQKPGQPQPPQFNLTAQQVASLTPDQRKQYMQSMQRFQQSKPQTGPLPTPEDMTLFQSIRQEEINKFKASADLPMDQDTRQAVAKKLVSTAPKLSNVSKVAPRWFTITHDENRLRLFFRTVSLSLYSPTINHN